jgi:hypothetical protein
MPAAVAVNACPQRGQILTFIWDSWPSSARGVRQSKNRNFVLESLSASERANSRRSENMVGLRRKVPWVAVGLPSSAFAKRMTPPISEMEGKAVRGFAASLQASGLSSLGAIFFGHSLGFESKP